MNRSAKPPILQVRNVFKRFEGVTALDDVSLDVAAGEVHAVIGENGAGKSTLMKILAGVQSPDSGSIELDGRPVVIDSVNVALELGIALIHQELNLADNLDVGANIFLGREPTKMGFIDFARIRRESKRHLARVGLEIDPRIKVSRLTIGLQQLVEIAKALSVNARILIMDEPTSSLPQHETEALFGVIDDLRSKGVTIIYISHRLGEIKRLADRVTVLRDGKNAGYLEHEKIDRDKMARLMVGRDVSQFYARVPRLPGNPVLTVKDLTTSKWPKARLSFSVRAGEIVGIAGLVGAGRTEILTSIFGVTPATRGVVLVDGKPTKVNNTRDAIDAGIVLVPEDRKTQGLIRELGTRSNIGLPGLVKHKKMKLFINRTREKSDSDRMTAELNIVANSEHQPVQFLSGGNQQKVVIGKWLSMDPRVLLMDEPTRGIDIGAKQEIYRLMESLAAAGVAILFVSSEMEEVLSMSDRVLVMHEGKITGQLDHHELTEETIMLLATGSEQTAKATTRS